MKYIAIAAALLATPAMADQFEEVIPANVCWQDNIAYSIGAYNPKVSSQYRGAVAANVNHGYGLFCAIKSGTPMWVYMDYDHENERWGISNMPLIIE